MTYDRDRLRHEIERDEGFVAHAYDDKSGAPVTAPRGWVTIGIGFLVDSRLGAGIPRAVAEVWLDSLLDDIESQLDLKLPWWRTLCRVRQRALMNMAYQMGVPRLLKFTRTLAALEAGDYAKAAAEALDSVWARDRSPARAMRISHMLEFG